MSVPAALGWLAAPVVWALAYLVLAAGRPRPWPWRRTACWLAGLLALALAASPWTGRGEGATATAHALEHAALWAVAAPLLVAGAPMRLLLGRLPSRERRALARLLHGPALRTLVRPLVAAGLFAVVVVVLHLPAVHEAATGSEGAHALAHALSLSAAALMWTPLIAADPVPCRASVRQHLACCGVCLLPMLAIAVWLATAAEPVYASGATSTADALADQRRAALLMVVCVVPALVTTLRATRTRATRRRARATARRTPAAPAAAQAAPPA